MLKRIGFVLVLIAIALVLVAKLDRSKTLPASANKNPRSYDVTATFTCVDGKSIAATFHLPEDENVSLRLSDGRELTLPHAISASGARYANESESIVFWNKGATAFIEEGASTTYADCVTTN